jgi:nitrate reductase delta subunit
MLYKILSLLLQYPDAELLGHFDEIRATVMRLDMANADDRCIIIEFLNKLGARPLLDLQADYVQTFDLTPDNTLHLTNHLFDEQDRARGPALVNLAEYFKRSGLELAEHELPDYLPLLLEYASTLDDPLSVQAFLQQMRAAVRTLSENLEKTKSYYAPLLRLVERHGQVMEQRTAATA